VNELRTAAPVYETFDHLATMVAVADPSGQCVFANAALEDIMGSSRRTLTRGSLLDWMLDAAPLQQTLSRVSSNEVSSARFDALIKRAPGAPSGSTELPVHVIVSQLDGGARVLVEMIEIEQQTRLDREERLHGQAQLNKELVRNLAHEIKNPLGGIRGAAQLLEMDLASPELVEYTQVIIHEADRLQALVDRLLDPHRWPHRVGDVNIHEVCERVRSLMLAEFPRGLRIERDYDISLPEFRGDREQLIQSVLNITRNAAQALIDRIHNGDACIVLRTRVARQATIARERFRLALDLHISDNGPGVPESIRDRIFHPLVSGRDGGTGLGLTLAQTFVEQHHGTIECESVPGRTVFKILIPLP
jgi:two-component system, NtrC family, nitrogen regulation sensor histidine kinase GlnL